MSDRTWAVPGPYTQDDIDWLCLHCKSVKLYYNHFYWINENCYPGPAYKKMVFCVPGSEHKETLLQLRFSGAYPSEEPTE